MMWVRIQGKAEDAVKALGFERTCVYRPGLLMCDREEPRAGEKLMRALAGAVDRSEKYSMSTAKVAKAMLVNSLRSIQGGLCGRAIVNLIDMCDKLCYTVLIGYFDYLARDTAKK